MYLQYYPPSCSRLIEGGIHPLPPELVWMSKLITVHAPGEYEKFVLILGGFLRRAGQAPRAGPFDLSEESGVFEFSCD